MEAALQDSDDRNLLRLLADLEQRQTGLPAQLWEQIKQELKHHQQVEHLQRESEQRYRTLFERSPDGVFAVNAEGRFLLANPACEVISGYSVQELLGKTFMDLCAPDCLAKTLENFRRSMAGQPENLETALIRKDGRRVELLLTGGPVIVDGKLVAVHCAAKAITERKQMEATLRASEERFRTILASLDEGVVWQEADGTISTANCSAERILGLTTDQMRGRTSFDLPVQITAENGSPLPGECHPAVIALQTGQPQANAVMGIHRLDGSLVWISVNARPLLDSHTGRPLAVVSSFCDITERKHGEEAICRQQRLIDAIFDNILAHVAYLDRNFNFVRVNATYAHGSGHRMEELIGRHHFDLFPNAENQAVFERVRNTGEPYVVRAKPFGYTDQPERGVTYWDWWLYPIQGFDGQTEGLVLSLVDVTPIERGRREVERLNAELQQASAAKDHFLAVLSHELRTPLTPVLTAVQMMERDQTLSAGQREAAALIRRNAELEARLIDDLLDLTRISRGKIDLHLEPVNLHERIQHVVKMLEPEVAAKRLKVAVQQNAAVPTVQADPTRLQQILWNLLRNAVKFTPEGGSITIRTENPNGNRITISVADTGIGIEPSVLPCIFGAFEQGGKDVTRQFGGLGLGLAISKGLVDLHGGTLRAHSEGRGQGATFILELPASVPIEADAPRSDPSDAGAVGSPGGRLLLVEDHPDTARTMSLLLRSFGYNVRVANGVASALRAAEAEPLDLVVSDLGLPDGSGLDLMRQLRVRYPTLKGIAVSGYGMKDDLRRSQEAGFAAHVTKPLNVERLEMVIREVLN